MIEHLKIFILGKKGYKGVILGLAFLVGWILMGLSLGCVSFFIHQNYEPSFYCKVLGVVTMLYAPHSRIYSLPTPVFYTLLIIYWFVIASIVDWLLMRKQISEPQLIMIEEKPKKKSVLFWVLAAVVGGYILMNVIALVIGLFNS